MVSLKTCYSIRIVGGEELFFLVPLHELVLRVLELLHDLPRRPLHLIGDSLPRLVRETPVRFAEVAVDDVLHRAVERPVRLRIPPGRSWHLGADVGLKRRVELDVLPRRERDKCANPSGDGDVYEGLGTAGHEARAGERRDDLANVVRAERLEFGRGVLPARVPEGTGAGDIDGARVGTTG